MFEYVRNDHFDANDWFVNRQRWDGLDVQRDCHGNPAGPCNAPKRPLKWNDFGYNLGGPFISPACQPDVPRHLSLSWVHFAKVYRQVERSADTREAAARGLMPLLSHLEEGLS